MIDHQNSKEVKSLIHSIFFFFLSHQKLNKPMGNIDGNTESTLKGEASEGGGRCQQEQHKSPSSHPLLQKKKGRLLSKKQSQLRTFLKHWKERRSPRIWTRGGKKEGGVGTKQKSLQNTGYCGDKAFQTHEGDYSSPPLFSFTQKSTHPKLRKLKIGTPPKPWNTPKWQKPQILQQLWQER